MEFFKWLSFYETGNEEIDNQHKKLISLVNEMFEAISKDNSFSSSKKIVMDLVDYTDYHFTEEEELFIKYKYPAAEGHLLQHKNFVDKIWEFKNSIENESKLVNMNIFTFLRDWLHNHIVKSDKEYAKFFKKIKAEEFK